MGRKYNLIGQIFGRLTVVEDSGNRDYDGSILWNCVCDCGKEKSLRTQVLKNGKTKSCGCLKTETTKKRATKHGGNGTRLYKIWDGMKSRCLDLNHKKHKYYGGKGVKVCKEWINFEGFQNWALHNGYQENLTIDRIDFDGNYEPNNCRWVTHREQMRNTSKNIKLTYQGETKLLLEWCEILDIKPQTVYSRKYKGFPKEWWLLPANELKRKVYKK